MIKTIRKQLAVWKKKTISLSELEKIFNNEIQSYEELTQIVLRLEGEHVLNMVKAKGRTGRVPSLAYQYRIDKSLLNAEYHLELQRYRLQLHSQIYLDRYYRLDPAVWENDLPYILKIDQFLKINQLPDEQVPAPERSFELVGDEKWIVEKGGKELLERTQLWVVMKITPVSDPLMFAVNPNKLMTAQQLHLIVENKTTYQGLLPSLQHSEFSTLIYGCGNKITSSIEQFSSQYPVQASHHFFYFGDIDRAGIAIWYSLNKWRKVYLAIPFYRACLQKTSASGKDYQRENKDAIDCFLSMFSQEEQFQIRKMFENGQYYPQEVLKTRELQRIWREFDWITLISKK